MYTFAQYRHGLKRAWHPVSREGYVFGKSLLTLDPSKYFGPCFRMVARFVAFLFIFAGLSVRKIFNL